MRSSLVRLLGFPATLLHGDTLVLDRWLWLKKQLPRIPPNTKCALDVGCGSGAFTIGAALRGYRTLGLSWDARNQAVAQERAEICRALGATFDVCDVRELDKKSLLRDQFDYVICCEVIEHVLDDTMLMVSMASCLKNGGTLLLTTPNINYKAITAEDDGPFSTTEDGWHVRRGYSEARLRELCATAGLAPVEFGFCSGFLSQKITGLMRLASKLHPAFGWVLVLPLRPLPPLLDPILTRFSRWPGYSITLIARKVS